MASFATEVAAIKTHFKQLLKGSSKKIDISFNNDSFKEHTVRNQHAAVGAKGAQCDRAWNKNIEYEIEKRKERDWDDGSDCQSSIITYVDRLAGWVKHNLRKLLAAGYKQKCLAERSYQM